MGEKRRKSTTILLRKQGKTVKLELFPASAWGGPAEAYRLRLDGCWHSPGGEQFRFYTPAGLSGVLFGLVADREPFQDAPNPPFRRGDRVAVPTGRTGLDGLPTYAVTFVAGQPILGIDGRWWAPVVGQADVVALDTVRGRS
jgi:hypothetical protein